MHIVDTIFTLFQRRGHAAYFGEPVSQLEHALQTAYQADQRGAPDYLIAAALLHDIGHLLHGMPDDIANLGVAPGDRGGLVGATFHGCRHGTHQITRGSQTLSV